MRRELGCLQLLGTLPRERAAHPPVLEVRKLAGGTCGCMVCSRKAGCVPTSACTGRQIVLTSYFMCLCLLYCV